MLEEIYTDTKNSLQKAHEAFKRELTKIRTGRANLAVVDGIRVEYYGTPTPLNQVAALNIADPRLITIKPWDKSLLGAIEKAIVGGNIGITPSNDGELVRLPIPPLTGEVRKNLVKELKKKAEDARVIVRNLRRDANEMVKAAEVSEDDETRALKQIQKYVDDAVAKIDADTNAKEKEIMEV
ncbi:MAG: ribosome recycling factor [Deltaproteobacteria bacterium]|jgi:ribosome recycling factor|nr:ribosome recycling factor [Deltaproteobacteria bacterium]